MPREVRRPCARVVETDDGGQTWMYDGQSATQRRLQRRRRTAGVRVRVRAGAVRRNAPRRMGHPRAGRGHGPQRHLRLAELPVVPAGLRRSAAAAGDHRPRPRDGVGPSVERLAPRRVGRRLPGPHHSVPAAVAARSRGRREDDLRNAERGFKAVTFSENPAHARAADHPLGLLGSDHARPAPRPAPWSTCTSVRRARRRRRRDDAPPDVQGVLFFGYAMFRGGRLAVLAVCPVLPGPQDLPVGRRHRLGGRAPRPPRPHAQLPRDVRHVDGARKPSRRRRCSTQLLVLRGRGPVVVRPARPHRRRQHPARGRLPALRLDLAAHPAHHPRADQRAARRDHPKSDVGERLAALSASRSRWRSRRTRTPTDLGGGSRVNLDRGALPHLGLFVTRLGTTSSE